MTRPTPIQAVAGPPRRRRVMLIDDHPMTRMGLAAVIYQTDDLEVCCEFSNPAEALARLATAKPELLVTALTMPGRSGIELLKDLHALAPEVPILVLSMHDESLYAERALRAGARGYLMKEAGAAKVLQVMRLLLDGECYVSPEISRKMLQMLAQHPHQQGAGTVVDRLSDRELEVFTRLGKGMATKEIAHELGVSPKTVAAHREHIKQKLEIRDALTLLREAVRWVESTQKTG